MAENPVIAPSVPKIAKKWKIWSFAISLLFVAIGIGAIESIVREPMFLVPARAKISEAKSLEQLGPIMSEIDREKALNNRYGVFALVMALVLPAAGLILVKRTKTFIQLVLLMLGAGIICGVMLTSLHGALHGLILPGGLQSDSYRGALRWAFLGLSLLDGLVVAAILQKAAFPKPARPA